MIFEEFLGTKNKLSCHLPCLKGECIIEEVTNQEEMKCNCTSKHMGKYCEYLITEVAYFSTKAENIID